MGGEHLEFRDDGLVTIESPPQFPEYTASDFATLEPYKYLCEHYSGSGAIFQIQSARMAENAKAVGFSITTFNGILKSYQKEYRADIRRSRDKSLTAFTGQPVELDCGEWECWDSGIFRTAPNGAQERACAHPIMPVRRLKNLDTNEERMELAFSRGGKWRTIVVGKDTISTARSITTLATQGISVTSSTASALVDFLNDIENRNYDVIPESKSIGRLGYIPGEGFSPYVDGLVFDGDASFKNLYGCVRARGSVGAWLDTAMECRKMSITARILLAASFASPILSIVGSLPFFVHLWGVDSGTGKTVALMLAASVWGDPALGSFTHTFNATQVGQERTAAFLNHLPFCIDELQLTKDSRGKSNFDVYQLAQGVGRARGRRNGGIDSAPTWSCCFLTTGESPIVSGSAGAGAVNRVIDIECTAGSAVITDGQRIANSLKQNYGFAGQTFVSKLYESEKVLEQVRQIYNDYFKELCAGDSTEKQAMAAAAILTADFLATHWIFDDDGELTPKDIRDFLASKEAVSAGHRAYDWLCDWVASNVNHFNSDLAAAVGETYGVLEGDMAYIIPSVFKTALQEAGFSERAVLSYLRNNRLIDTGASDEYSKPKQFGNVRRRYICLHLGAELDEAQCIDDEIL